jgi:glutamine amidotransferase
MICIVDYGMANLRSVQKAIEKTGYDASITSDPGDIGRTDLLVLPGVGAFDQAVKNLKDRELWLPIQDHLDDSKPFLGICLGLQLLFEGSEEGTRSGFGYFRGQCTRFRSVEPIPHMGWNEVEWSGMDDLHDPGAGQPQCFYFVHSFFPEPKDDAIVAGQTEYGGTFCCAARSSNVLGVQFHPEKSQYAGLNLIENYLGSLDRLDDVPEGRD